MGMISARNPSHVGVRQGTVEGVWRAWSNFMEPYNIEIKDIVKDNCVQFVRYRQGVAYYSVYVNSQNQTFLFPVPLDDVADATLQASDKAILFMRYIRRAIKEGSFVPYVVKPRQ